MNLSIEERNMRVLLTRFDVLEYFLDELPPMNDLAREYDVSVSSITRRLRRQAFDLVVQTPVINVQQYIFDKDTSIPGIRRNAEFYKQAIAAYKDAVTGKSIPEGIETRKVSDLTVQEFRELIWSFMIKRSGRKPRSGKK